MTDNGDWNSGWRQDLGSAAVGESAGQRYVRELKEDNARLLAALDSCVQVLEALPIMERAGASHLSLWPGTLKKAKQAITQSRARMEASANGG